MRLHHLRLTNYRCYADLEIDFSDIRGAVISGANGRGKSTLVEGLLWVLYGHSRSSSVAGMVRIGETKCVGTLEFSADGERYRISRKRQLTGGGSRGELSFSLYYGLVLKPAGDQDDIDRIVGMSYETLVSSSVIQQGEAARFTTAPPEDRRGVMRGVLGLQKWRTWRKSCADKSGRRKTQAWIANEQVDAAGDVDAKAEAADKAHADATKALESLSAELDRAVKDHDEAQAAYQAAEQAERDVAETRESMRRMRVAMADLDTQIEDCNARIGDYERDTANLEAVERAAELLDVREDALTHAIADLTAAEAKANKALEALHNVERSPDVLEAERHVEALRLERERVREDGERYKHAPGDVKRYDETIDRLTTERSAELARARTADTVPCHSMGDLRTPMLCPLLRDAYSADKRASDLRAQIFKAKKRREQAKHDAALLEAAARKHSEADKAWSDAKDEARGILDTAKDKARMECAVAREAVDAARRGREEAVGLANESRSSVQIVDSVRASAEHLRRETERLDSLAKYRDQMERDYKSLVGGLGDCQSSAAIATVAASAADNVTLLRDQITEATVAELRAKDASRDAWAMCDQVVAWMAESERLQQEHAAWAGAEKVCELAPIIAIERALPIVEAEANRVLSLISSRGMSVRIETQRAVRRGGRKREVIDIIGRDEVGERPYEDFSGGEQLRLDIALRLGLARLACDRERSSLDMLIIDEGGFGQLDAEGVSALKQTIAELQRHYGLVLLVTHLEDMADVLPTTINVSSGNDGSVVEYK